MPTFVKIERQYTDENGKICRGVAELVPVSELYKDLPVVPATFADVAAVRTYLNTLVTALKDAET